MPRAKPSDYEPCPACGGRRWRGKRLPVCDTCEDKHVTKGWHLVHYNLRLSNASIVVMSAVHAAIIADVRERIASTSSPAPYRR